MKASLASPKAILTAAAALAVAACGPMESVTTKTTADMGKVGESFGKMGSGIGNGFGKVADLTMSPFRPAVPVVEARQDDLKELQSGHDQALAFQRKQNQNNFWSFLGPVNFKEPALPSDGGAMDGGLLPPLE